MRFSKLYLPICFVFLFLISCNKDNEPEPVVLTTISPTTGPHSTVVTITGSGFNSNAASNLVKFNGKEAVVQSATATQLVVVVPKSAGTGAVSVQDVAGPEFKFEFTTVVTTLAGNGKWNLTNGMGTSAEFFYPSGVAVDTIGNLYVADRSNHCIRKITPAGLVSTFAGNKSQGFADAKGTSARFYYPTGITIDKNGNLYVADDYDDRIRKITPSGEVTTFAGTGDSGSTDGAANIAKFTSPTGIACDSTGNLFVCDLGNNKIRKITPAGVVSTIHTNMVLTWPRGIAVDANGYLYVTDLYNRIFKITQDGTTSIFAGSTNAGNVDGTGTSARFKSPYGLTISKDGNLYVSDGYNNSIRKITSEGIVTTIAGTGEEGFADGNKTSSKFKLPYGIAIDQNLSLYIADYDNHRIRKIVQE